MPHFHMRVSLAAGDNSDDLCDDSSNDDPVTEPEDIFDVEAILDEKKDGKRLFYLVQWTGYGDDEATWEPRASLNHNEVFKAYLKKKK